MRTLKNGSMLARQGNGLCRADRTVLISNTGLACASDPHSMISDFDVRYLDSIIHLLARPKLVYVAEQASLSLNWSHIPKTGFLVTWLI